MPARQRFLIAVIVLGALMTGPFLLTAAVLLFDAGPAERETLVSLLGPRVPLGALITVAGFALGLSVLRKLFQQYVNGLLEMAEQARLMLGANRQFRVAASGPPEVGELARAMNALASQRDELLTDVDTRIDAAKAAVEAERNRLAALMADLAQGVIVCNMDGRILLYNNRARLQYKAMAQGGSSPIGLGRSIFSVLDRLQITHTLNHIQQRVARGGARFSSNFVTSTRGGQLLRAQMSPVIDQGVISGFVLSTENITRDFERETRRDQVLQEIAGASRTALSAIRYAAESQLEAPAMDTEQRQRSLQLIIDEAAVMMRRLETAMNDFADALKTRWPLDDILGADLIAAATHRIKETLTLPLANDSIDPALWVRADSFSLIQAITFLAARLQDHYDIRELRLGLSGEGSRAFLDLAWHGAPISSETLYTWEMEPMNIGAQTNPLSLRDVIERHGGEMWLQREKATHRLAIRLVLPMASRDLTEDRIAEEAELSASASRPEYYDFDLFAARNAKASGIDAEQKLSELSYSVFDTETTGLEPSAGDEIIQFGAVRIVNGRLLRQETFDQLVDPQMPLKPEGIPIHGIRDDMVRGQPVIATVLPAFHDFCAETVLVAHNAAFDMRFLQIKEDALGIRFVQPVLDTLLLSSVIHPNQESHALEAIAERLGINIIGRHTALGDAFVTGEIFLKMIPLLADMGIHTLRQALDAAQKSRFAKVGY